MNSNVFISKDGNWCKKMGRKQTIFLKKGKTNSYK